MMPFYFGIDPTYILVIIGIAISGAASAYVNSTFRKYDQVRSSKHVTGTQAAQYILQKEQNVELIRSHCSIDIGRGYWRGGS